MLTRYVTTPPETPAFVSKVRQHLTAAQGMDNTIMDKDPTPGNVQIHNDELDLSVKVNSDGTLQSFRWRDRPEYYSEKESFSIHRSGQEEVVSHSTTSTSEWDFATLVRESESAGFNITNGGLLWVSDDRDTILP
jgi:hypothetical protein